MLKSLSNQRSTGPVFCGQHEEATPSLYIDNVTGRYTCFGCGVSGVVEWVTLRAPDGTPELKVPKIGDMAYLDLRRPIDRSVQ